MKKETYLKMTGPFRDHPKLARSLHITNRILTGIIFLAYVLFLIWLFVRRDEELLRMILVPLDGLIAVTVFRYLMNRPRPYEAFGEQSLIPKKTKGKSFPSRHVFSAAVITGAFFVYGLWLTGIVCLVVTVFLAVIRVVSGVHYISDVIAGVGFAVAAYGISFLF